MKKLIHCLLYGVKKNEKYPEIVRDFCLKIHFISIRAYNAIRLTFNNNLPHSATIRHWYSNSDMESKPGINYSCMKILRRKAEKKGIVNSKLLVSICFDEMFIRRHFQWCNQTKRMLGFPTYPLPERKEVFGTNELNRDEAANQAIVFMAVGINDNFKLPIAYHFVKSLKSVDRTTLVRSIVDEVSSTGAIVNNISFDGFSGNKKMCSLIGADLRLESDDFKPFFTCSDAHKVFIMFDVPHLIKCVRGILESHSYLIDLNGKRIEWKYFIELVILKKSNGLNFTHKLSQSHIQFKNRKMKVDLAVQTLSRSVANSMRYLMHIRHPKFIDAGPTIDMVEIFDQLFDIFNTKLRRNNAQENLFKRPLSAENEHACFEFFERAIKYIKGMKILSKNGKLKPIIHSQQGTGFKGFIVNMYTLMQMYNETVKQNKIVECLPTYSMNQDHVEIFFGKSRAMYGHNDNPTVQQFQSSFRKILVNTTDFTSKKGNCVNFDTASDPFSDILFVTSRLPKNNHNNQIEEIVPEELDDFLQEIKDIEVLQEGFIDPSCFDQTLIHIASKIEMRMKMEDDYCKECIMSFEQNRRVENSFIGLKHVPCHSTYMICKNVDRFLKVQFLRDENNISKLYFAIADQLDIESLYSASDFKHNANHKLYLIRAVVDTCFQIKATFLAQQANFTGPETKRHRYRKLIHFYGH